MKALTIWQPWASLIAIGAKPYEFRGWPPPRWLIGKPLAIHAGARPVRKREVQDLIARLEERQYLHTICLRDEALPFLRRVLLGLGEPAPSLFEARDGIILPRSCVVAIARVGAPKLGAECAREFGFMGQPDAIEQNWGWPLTEIDVLMPPHEATGAQGLWDWRGR